MLLSVCASFTHRRLNSWVYFRNVLNHLTVRRTPKLGQSARPAPHAASYDQNRHASLPTFVFRSFSRRMDGEPKKVRITQGRVYVDDVLVDTNNSVL